MSRPRIGVFGGAFDPPHEAHVALARAALTQLDLVELRIFPTGHAWHKQRVLSAPEHRLAMAHLAFDELARTVVDARELLRPGPTYTIDTLRELQHEKPGAQLVLIIGADQAAAFAQWHGVHDILALAIIAMAYRSTTPGADPAAEPRILPSLPAGARCETLDFTPMPESATEIRARASHGEPISNLVPPTVASYIDRHHLYRST